MSYIDWENLPWKAELKLGRWVVSNLETKHIFLEMSINLFSIEKTKGLSAQRLSWLCVKSSFLKDRGNQCVIYGSYHQRARTIGTHNNTDVPSPSLGDQESEIKVLAGLVPSGCHMKGTHSTLPSLACRLPSSPCIVLHGLPSGRVPISKFPFLGISVVELRPTFMTT